MNGHVDAAKAHCKKQASRMRRAAARTGVSSSISNIDCRQSTCRLATSLDNIGRLMQEGWTCTIRHSRCRIGRLRSRQPPQRRSRPQSTAAGGGARGAARLGRAVRLADHVQHEPSIGATTRSRRPAAAAARVFWPRGKMIGGSGSLNAMIYIRGLPSDYDGWAAMGCPGWNWMTCCPYSRPAKAMPNSATTRCTAPMGR